MDELDPVSARAILREASRRSGVDIAAVQPVEEKRRIPRLLDPKHKFQFAAFSDTASKIVIDAGGRSGKTTGSVRWLMEGALAKPRAMNLFIGLTRLEAKLLAWDELKAVNEQFALGFTFNESDLTARAPNGSKIRLIGADKHKEIRKARGHKYNRIVLEECGAQGKHLKELVQDVLEPRTVDLNGQIAMLGTPNAARAGFFFDAVHGLNGAKGWSHHHWTLFDNPYLPHARKWVQENLFDLRGWTDEHPTFCREYLGKWVRDDSAMVYQFERARNTYKRLPTVEKWSTVLGIDTGWRDSTAFVVWGWHRDHAALHELFAFKRPKLGITPIMKIVAKLHETYNLRGAVIDPAGVGTFLVDELNERWSKPLRGLKIELAEKKKKRDHIELFNDDMRTGKILAREDSLIAEEWALLQWDETGEDEDERFENHLSDAALYGWRRAQHFRHKPKPDGPQPGTAEWERQKARSIERQLQKRRRPNKNRSPLERDPLALRCISMRTGWASCSPSSERTASRVLKVAA